MDHELHAVIEGNPKSSHPWVRDSDFAFFALLQKNRNNTASATDNVPVARTTETGVLRTGIRVGLYEHLFSAEFGRTIKIDRIYRLVRAKGKDPPYALIDRGVDHVATAHDVGLDRFEGIVFTGRDLLEGSCVNHHRYAREGTLQPRLVPNIADEIAQARMVETGRPHVVLLQFIATEDDKFLGVIVPQHDLDKFLAE